MKSEKREKKNENQIQFSMKFLQFQHFLRRTSPGEDQNLLDSQISWDSQGKLTIFSQKMSVWVNKVNRISVSVWGCAVWKKFPAMAYARTSAGPAGRPGAGISQIRDTIPGKTFVPRHFLFGNRSLVDCQIRKGGHGGDLDENGCFL